MTTGNKQKRDALLGELESIRSLLGEDSQHAADRELIAVATSIPLLIPDEEAVQHIPVLSTVAADTSPHAPPAMPEQDPLAAIRQAAAKIAAKTSGTTSPVPIAHDREKLVDDVVKAALPRLEQLLRELVQEALLQDKLRGGRR